MKIYLNGTLWHSGAGNTATMSGIAAASLGGGASYRYAGMIDDVQLYNVALDAQAVADLYGNGIIVNTAPVANSSSVSVNEDSSVSITLSGSDADGDSLSYAVVSQPANGSLSGTAPNLTYIPDADYSGSDSFTFRVNDGSVNSADATVSITVNEVNIAPVANAQSVSVDEDRSAGITLSGSDADGDSLSYAVVSQPANGSLSGTAPNLTYTPDAGYNGSDSFTFRVNDGSVNSAAATVSITINASPSGGGVSGYLFIEAEDYTDMSGIQTETSDDAGGGENVGWIDAGDWMDYVVTVPSAGTYELNYRVASKDGGGSVQLQVNGTAQTTVSIDSTGGWQNWTTLSTSVSLSAGTHTIRLHAAAGGWNINWLEFIQRSGATDLIAYWKLDDGSGTTAADSSGNGFDGAVTDGTWTTGTDGGALDFNGSSSLVTLPASAFADVSDQITIAMWVYGDTTQPRNDSVFYATDAAGSWVLNIHLPWSNSAVYWDAGDSGYDRINKEASAADFMGDWNHWVFTKNATTGVMKIYLNGVLWHTGTGKVKTMTGITTPTLGGGSGYRYDGMIDEVQLYNIALDDQDVADLYLSGVGLLFANAEADPFALAGR
ncbi:Ig-like domain-containing protein [Pontiellaceae bacterium B12219]|nr:Ig-like domain-containing protein [Pontiellaceae bacterium B12219]